MPGTPISQKPTLFALLTVAAALAVLSACGGGGSSTTTTPPPPPKAQPKTFVYVPSGVVTGGGLQASLTGAGDISEFEMAANGTLTKLASSPLSFSTNIPMTLAADPQGRFIFGSSLNNIFTFSITATTGALTQVSSVALPPAAAAAALTVGRPMLVDHAGTFLYAATPTGLNVYSIASNGALTSVQAAASPSACPGTNGLALDGAGKFLYVSGCEGLNGQGPNAKTVAFSVDSATGMLTMVSSVPAGQFGNSGGVAVTPAGNFVYVESETPPQNSVYASNNGTLTFLQAQDISTLDDFNGGFIVMHPSGKFLYETTVNSLIGFSIAANGSLTEISPFRGFLDGLNFNGALAVGPALSFGLDPKGSFVLVVGELVVGQTHIPGITLAVLSVDANTGNLTPVAGSPFTLDMPSGFPGAPVAVTVPQP